MARRSPTLAPGKRRGVALAVAAYIAWGFLSPIGQLLLDKMGPFTLNAVRSLLAIPLLLALVGPRTAGASLRGLTRDIHVWIVGAVWLGLTFIPYVWSLEYLPPTITTLTVYLTPLLVAGWQFFVRRERVSILVLPVVAVTLVGGWLAIQGPHGVALDRRGTIGLALALTGVIGWVGYTLHVKWLTETRDPNTITVGAIIASCVPFVIGAAAYEGFDVVWDAEAIRLIAVYVLLPTVLSFWLYSLSLSHADASTIATLLGVELVSTAIISAWLTGESFDGPKLAGLGLVAAAITVYLWNESRKTPGPLGETTGPRAG